jgi:photosystem II stability/assembly factor-like uncharacterized protein
MAVTETCADQAAVAEAQALFEEARRRRRRRYRWSVLGATPALIVIAAVFAAGGGRSASPPPRPGQHPPGRASTTLQHSASAPAGVPGKMVLYIGTAGPRIAWALNGEDFYVSTDRGRSWRNATPQSLARQEAGDRFAGVTGFGTDDLWMTAEDVIGLVPFSQSVDGSDRGEEILRSTDGGRTWRSSILPGCLQACGGNMSVSFVDALHGFVSVGPGPSNSSYVFGTSDGGATWSALSTLSFAPGGASLVFSDPEHGWAVTGPTFDAIGNLSSPGSALYRTTDGGHSWTPAPGLPTNGEFQVPTFFNAEDGVVFDLDPSPVVFVTSDGGSRWTKSSIPVSGSAASLRPPPQFSSPTPQAWFLSWGRSLLETTDAGTRWTTIDTKAPWPSDPGPGPSKGGAWGLTFFTANEGWAVVGLPPCKAPTGCTGEGAIATSDGGLTWHYLNP